MKTIKNIIWLAKHKEEIEKLMIKPKEIKKKEDKRIAFSEMATFQKDYIENIINDK